MGNFRFNPAYNIDLLLFREILGTVSNAAYFKPWAAFYFFNHFSARVDVEYALAMRKQGTLGDKQAEELKTLAACIVQQNKNVILEAHADNVGTEEYNIQLSDRRGNSVKSLLVEKGAPAELLQVLAKGSLESTGTTEAERSKDRRVQFIFP